MPALEVTSSFEHLDPETRGILTSLLDTRAVLLTKQAELTRLRAEAIRNPTSETRDKVQKFSAESVKPLRDVIAPMVQVLAIQAVDDEKFKDMLPMALAGLSQALDLPLLFTTLGLDPDIISEIIGKVQEYFRSGLDGFGGI